MLSVLGDYNEGHAAEIKRLTEGNPSLDSRVFATAETLIGVHRKLTKENSQILELIKDIQEDYIVSADSV